LMLLPRSEKNPETLFFDFAGAFFGTAAAASGGGVLAVVAGVTASVTGAETTGVVVPVVPADVFVADEAEVVTLGSGVAVPRTVAGVDVAGVDVLGVGLAVPAAVDPGEVDVRVPAGVTLVGVEGAVVVAAARPLVDRLVAGMFDTHSTLIGTPPTFATFEAVTTVVSPVVGVGVVDGSKSV
jgi:hypothetical protein